jgi:hypothetical protein
MHDPRWQKPPSKTPTRTQQAISPPNVETAAVQIDAVPKAKNFRVILHLGVIIFEITLPTGPIRNKGTV